MMMIGAAALAVAAPTITAQAQPAWPKQKVIRWLVGVPAGGGVDAVTRAVANKVSQKIGQRIVVENRPGANQAIALDVVGQSNADGYTVITIAGPTLYGRAVKEIGNGLAPVALLGRGPLLLAGTTARKVPDFATLIAEAKKSPEQWSFGSSGIASVQHLAGELMNRGAGTKIMHVPYRGASQAINDAIAAQIPLLIVGPGPVMPQIEAGLLRGYAVTSAKRYSPLPNIPTMAELGLGDFDLTSWFGVGIKQGTSQAIVDALGTAIREVTATPEMGKLLLSQGIFAEPMSPKEFGEFYISEKKKLTNLANELGVKVH
jgi:tripartite-type tricarboxylate transporter receptor subunit TctC